MFAPPLPTAGIGYQHHQFPLGIASHGSPSSPFQEPHSPALTAPETPFQDEFSRSASPAAGMQRSPSRTGPSPQELAEDGRATPMNAITKHPKLRLQLSLGADAFEAGGNVHGRMELSALTGRGMRIGEIAVELEAAEELHSRDHSARQTFLYARTLFQGAHLPPSNAVVPQTPITTSSHTHSGSTVWWTARKGKTTFPFSFPVPVRAPSSVQFAGNASLRYVLKGTAQIWIAPTNQNAPSASPHDHQHQQRHLITVRAEVPVVERWPLMLVKSISTHPLFYESIESVAETRVFLGGNGAVWLEANLSRSLFLSGSEMHLRVSVRNNTKRHVSGVKVSLARRLVFPVIRSDERDPGGPGSLLRPPVKTLQLQGGGAGGAGQQPMITEVVSEQVFKSAGSTSSQSGVNYEFPPSEETTCVLPVRVPYDLRSVGLGVPCGPEHGGEELAQQQAAGQLHDPRFPPGSGWSGRSLLFEVHILLRVALPLGALAKDLVVELPIWVIHPRSVGAEGVKLLMEAKDMALQNPHHQHPGVPNAAENVARQGPRHSLGSHEHAYQNVAPQRPHSSAGQRQLPIPGQMSPLHLGPQVTPYNMPMSPSPHSLAPLQQYAIERGWSPAPVHPGPDPLALPSIAAVLPARPSTAMDSFRPPVTGIVPPAPQPVPGMMVAIPQTSVPATYAYGNEEQGLSPGFVFDPTATDWRASRMLVGPGQATNQQHGNTIQRSMSAAPDVGGSAPGSQILQQVTTFANIPTSRSPQPSPSASPAPSIRHVGETSSTRGSLLRNTVRSVSGPLPLPSSTLSVNAVLPQTIQNEGPIEVPRPSPSPGPSDERKRTMQSTTPAKYHQHTPTPPASMLSDSRPSPTSTGPVLGAKVIAAPAAQRAAPPPQDVYAQLALHSHSRILSEVAEEADDYEEEDEEHGHSRQPSEKPRPSVIRSVPANAAPPASMLETTNPVPTRSLTAKDIAALEKMADQSMSSSESSLRSVRVEKGNAGGEAVSARAIFDQPKPSPSQLSSGQPEQVPLTSGRAASVKDMPLATKRTDSVLTSSTSRRSVGAGSDAGRSESSSRVGSTLEPRSPTGLDDLEKRLTKRASVDSFVGPPAAPAKPIKTFANVAPERETPVVSTPPARFLGAADFKSSRSAVSEASPPPVQKPEVVKEQSAPAVSLSSVRRQSLDVAARPSWLDDHDPKFQSTKRTEGSQKFEPKRSRHSIDVTPSTGSAIAAALASPPLVGSARAASLSKSPAAKTKDDNSWIRDRSKPADRAAALSLEKKPTIDQILNASKTDVVRKVSDGKVVEASPDSKPAPGKTVTNLVGAAPPKIKPVKKPTPVAAYLNAASPQGVFVKEVTSAPVPAPAPAPAPAPEPEVVAPAPRIHPYSALALRPTRRQSMDFKGRAAAFEGKSSESTTADEGSMSGLKSRSRHSIDVARPSITPQASAFASPPLPSPIAEPKRTESVASLAKSSTANIPDDDAWIQRFSKVSTKPMASIPKVLKPTASIPRPAVAAEKVAVEEHLQIPKRKDLSTVDGRGTTKAIGSNRLRELRSVWGS
ncbi:hypothetical protein OC846_001138 [Tilletia horrida]|uniref:Arrestin C-terminal-like domain-containing protein n=1 Tax=Tilletia horrida TaxID=155126 RepID=A0AAN6K063_9BASI|nr:hypothetical protein OC846_001138 [Tilletia horrida]KAK0569371.1 hypothetical protein OC861_000977 [Tilletia horrida]